MPHSASITGTRADLRALIDPWAARYSPDREFRRRLVERTILVLTDDPSLLDGPSVDRAIFRVVHHLAISELSLAAPRARRPYLSPRGMQATNVFPKSSSRKEVVMSGVLNGRRYLIVEDEYLVASDILSTLENAGATVLGPVSDVEHALEVLANESFTLDAAVLDINLQGQMVYPAANLLAKRGTPFIFVTGYDCSDMPSEFTHAPCITKPCDDATLVEALAAMASSPGSRVVPS